MLDIHDEPKMHRYVAVLDGEFAGDLRYKSHPRELVATHVGEAFGGRGVGSALVKFALDDARTNDLKIVPICPFVAAYIERHPEYADLVA